MSVAKLTIPIEARVDKNGNTFYVGKMEFPGTIDFENGAVFLVYISDKGAEEIQVGVLKKKQKDSDEE